MRKTIEPSAFRGMIIPPASKSVVQRALAAALLAKGETWISGFSESDDAWAALNIIKLMGAEIDVTGTENDDYKMIMILGNPPINKFKKLYELKFNCGESGLSARLFAPLSLLYSDDVQLNGCGSLLNRPFGALMKPAFEQMGVKYSDNKGKLPVNLRGELSAKKITIDGSGGSQFLSGILMTLPLLNEDSVVEVLNLKSKPYIDLTLNVLSKFGIEIINENYEVFKIKAKQKYKHRRFNIEGDWSGASCLLVAGAIAGEVTFCNLDYNSTQADKKIIEVLQAAGANVDIKRTAVTVGKNKLQAFDFDATDSPDLFPALVSLAANCEGISRIKGVNRLATKESNRALTLQSEYAKIGIVIDLDADYMTVKGGEIRGAIIDSHNDHRIAMSLAVAALNSKSAINIENADCVNKSYPGFWRDLEICTNHIILNF